MIENARIARDHCTRCPCSPKLRYSPVVPRTTIPSAPWSLNHAIISLYAPSSNFRFLSYGVQAATRNSCLDDGLLPVVAGAPGAAIAAAQSRQGCRGKRVGKSPLKNHLSCSMVLTIVILLNIGAAVTANTAFLRSRSECQRHPPRIPHFDETLVFKPVLGQTTRDLARRSRSMLAGLPPPIHRSGLIRSGDDQLSVLDPLRRDQFVRKGLYVLRFAT